MANNTPNHDTRSLPVITIDPTFANVIDDVNAGLVPSEQFWVSCYKTDQPSVHAKVHAELDEVDRDLVRLRALEGDVQVVAGRKGYTVSCTSLGIPHTRVALPVQEYRDSERSIPQKPQRITAFDIAPDGSRFATGFLDGAVLLYPSTPLPPSASPFAPTPITATPATRTAARPHLSTITHLRFFPSSRVLLTAAADFALAVLPADLPPPPGAPGTGTGTAPLRVAPARTLRGHTRAVTATAIIARGRTVLSASLDGTVRLWDVPGARALATLPARAPVLAMCLADAPLPSSPSSTSTPMLAVGEDPPQEHDQTTLFAGLQSGALEIFDLRAQRSVHHAPSPSPSGGLSALAHAPAHHLLATGTTRGAVRVFDVRWLGGAGAGTGGREDTPLAQWRRNDAGVEGLAFLARGGAGGEGGVRLAVGGADGLPYVVGLSGAGEGAGWGVGVDVELAGGDCDPVRAVRALIRDGEAEGQGEAEVWSAGDDAVVRRYLV